MFEEKYNDDFKLLKIGVQRRVALISPKINEKKKKISRNSVWDRQTTTTNSLLADTNSVASIHFIVAVVAWRVKQGRMTLLE
jgi:hypothetical protein